MMQYMRCPRPTGLNLEREQLRVYMMCDGRRELGEVASLTRLDLSTVSRVIQELLGLCLLEAVRAPVDIQFPLQPEVARPAPAPVPPAAAGLLPQLEGVLVAQLGNRAEPFVQQLRACPDTAAVQEQAARIAVKLKLTVNKQVAEAFSRTLKTALA